MDITVNNNTASYAATVADSASQTAAETAAETTAASTEESTAAVYEKSTTTETDSASTLYNKDAIVNKLKLDQQARINSMQSLVENLLSKQGKTYNTANSTSLADLFRTAANAASPEDIAKAQEDISEDGYWGVEQTSDRLVSMAIALSGGDTSKADELMEAIQKGFDKATQAWGEDLPQICQDTLEATMKKMEDWKNGVTSAEDYSTLLG
ncbi:MAG: hypothetical protein LUH14_09090 [Clostridiaceae bacterium]|nr:hypothetical protein [Clostridiaceae bacterium]